MAFTERKLKCYGCHGDYRHSRGAAGDGGDPAFRRNARSGRAGRRPRHLHLRRPRLLVGGGHQHRRCHPHPGNGRGRRHDQCARCLEDVTYGLEGDIEGYFLIGGEEEAETPEDMEGDEFDFLPDNRKIDLVPLVVAACCSRCRSCPVRRRLQGLCPQCGANLNEGPAAAPATRQTWRRARSRPSRTSTSATSRRSGP